jgi:hypothetical protein
VRLVDFVGQRKMNVAKPKINVEMETPRNCRIGEAKLTKIKGQLPR